MTTIVSSLSELPTDRVLGLYQYGYRQWAALPMGHERRLYYLEMMQITLAEIVERGLTALASLPK